MKSLTASSILLIRLKQNLKAIISLSTRTSPKVGKDKKPKAVKFLDKEILKLRQERL